MTRKGESMNHYCFDCDDTLYDSIEPFVRTMAEFIPDLSLDMKTFYKEYRKFGDDVFDLLQEGTITLADSGIYRIYKVCQKWGIPFTLEQSADFQERYNYWQNHLTMDPDLKEWLDKTKADLWILSNGPDAHQRAKMKALGLERWFQPDHIFTSGQIGAAKPEGRAFAAVTEDPADWFYIGDNYINDMEGAKAAGWQTIHYNRHNGPTGPAADHVVSTGRQLADLLEQLEAEDHV